MSDTNTKLHKLHDDLMGLRETAQYAALATAPESDHREIARLKGEIELLALAVNLKIGLSRKLYHVECSHCGTRYSDASSRFPICPNCHQVARVWLRDEAEIDPEGSS